MRALPRTARPSRPGRRSLSLRAAAPTLAAVAALAVVAASAGTAAAASPATSRAAARPALAPTATAADKAGPHRPVIVLMKNQHAEAPATRATLGVRRARVRADQAPVQKQVAAAGGSLGTSFTTLNGFAASVPSGDLAALRADPAVAAVVPDLPLTRRTVHQASTTPAPGTSPAPAPANACPTDRARPKLEPQALEVTHTASDDPHAPTARKLGATGSGVTVGFIADGVDVTNPDFIRADGSRVITDYKDFTGDGTAAPTSGAEAFGDASSIAAQGRVAHDLSTFVNPAAQTLPAGCTIRIEGIAPGAEMVALKVFGAGASSPTSGFLAAIEYAVNVDHVDVINESFGVNPYPDNGTDPISIFDENAVAAGVTVVASTGDAGIGGTIGSPSSSPGVIQVGASTTFRLYSQIGYSGFPLSNGTYGNDQSSALSSAGITQGGSTPGPFVPGRYTTSGVPRDPRTLDLIAPGDLNWSACTADANAYLDCTNAKGEPSSFIEFGGTSESSPLTAGAAALVIQAYRSAHHGTSPVPDQVRRIIDGSADDLGLPAQEQGAGRLNTYRAVQLALATGASSPSGAGGLLLSSPNLTGHAAPGALLTRSVTVTNAGRATRQVAAFLRAVDAPVATTTTSTTLTSATADGTFVDAFGTTRIFRKVPFTVPTGADRVEVDGNGSGDGTKVLRLALLDPTGRYTAYSFPQGTGNTAVTDVHDPAPGRWTAIVFSTADPTAGYQGPVTLRVASARDRAAGTVSPAAFSLPAGASRTLQVSTTAPRSGSAASSLVLASNGLGTISGTDGATTLPVVTSAVSRVTAAGVLLSGTFTKGNGRDLSPAQSDTYLLDVPAGKPRLAVDVRQPTSRPNNVSAYLISPEGEPLGLETNEKPVLGGGTRLSPGLTVSTLRPRAGRWTLVVVLNNPVTGAALPQPYTATVSFRTLAVSATGLPAGARIKRGATRKARVTITNNGPSPEALFLDPRTTWLATYPLVPQSATTDLPLHPTGDQAPPSPTWLVPTQSTSLLAQGLATQRAFFDLFPVVTTAPDVESTFGTSPKAQITAGELSPGIWGASPGEIGPFGADPAPDGSISLTASASTLAFDRTVTSPTGDYWLQAIDSSAAVSPVVLPPGASTTLTATFRPTAARGATVTGRLFVDTVNPVTSSGSELAVLPYRYTVR